MLGHYKSREYTVSFSGIRPAVTERKVFRDKRFCSKIGERDLEKVGCHFSSLVCHHSHNGLPNAICFLYFRFIFFFRELFRSGGWRFFPCHLPPFRIIFFTFSTYRFQMYFPDRRPKQTFFNGVIKSLHVGRHILPAQLP